MGNMYSRHADSRDAARSGLVEAVKAQVDEMIAKSSADVHKYTIAQEVCSTELANVEETLNELRRSYMDDQDLLEEGWEDGSIVGWRVYNSLKTSEVGTIESIDSVKHFVYVKLDVPGESGEPELYHIDDLMIMEDV